VSDGQKFQVLTPTQKMKIAVGICTKMRHIHNPGGRHGGLESANVLSDVNADFCTLGLDMAKFDGLAGRSWRLDATPLFTGPEAVDDEWHENCDAIELGMDSGRLQTVVQDCCTPERLGPTGRASSPHRIAAIHILIVAIRLLVQTHCGRWVGQSSLSGLHPGLRVDSSAYCASFSVISQTDSRDHRNTFGSRVGRGEKKSHGKRLGKHWARSGGDVVAVAMAEMNGA
jgi:hypothetical protein